MWIKVKLLCWLALASLGLGYPIDLRDDADDHAPKTSTIPELNPEKYGSIIINTWPFLDAARSAWDSLESGLSALDAVERGCSTCEELRCDGTVGYGGSPDEMGDTSLDACIMDGNEVRAGAVANLRHVKEATSTARLVLEHTTHTLLAGLEATKFAHEMGMPLCDLGSKESADIQRRWRRNHCQPNFRTRVKPDPKRHCGPYHLSDSINETRSIELEGFDESRLDKAMYDSGLHSQSSQSWPSSSSHDTIAMIAKDRHGNMAAACSSNGAVHKVPGRVGDAAIPGGGIYVDSQVGGCGATGDGDVHLRFLPCFQVVELLREGKSPQEAAEIVIRRIAHRVDGYVGAVVALSKDGSHGAAAAGWKDQFSYAYRDSASDDIEIVRVKSLI